MRKKLKVKITKEDAEYILGKDADFLKVAENNVFCSDCYEKTKKPVTIVNYDIYVDDLGGIVLRGFCKECGKPVGRYIESGEKPDEFKRAMRILKERGKNSVK
jgi:hypothetical protein